MNINALKLAYFSPTGTTRKILNGIAEGFGADSLEQIDLTLPDFKTPGQKMTSEELVILGVPVYEGRVSNTAIPRLQQLKAYKTPAVLVVVFGNRDYEDALFELNDLSREIGFIPVASAAFIGEHSFAREDRPMANGRPDAEDISRAREFGAAIRTRLEKLESINDANPITPPGKHPYVDHDRSALEDRAATTDHDLCNLCGDCVPLCPVGAITMDESVETDNMACTLCNACIKACPEGARLIDDPMINKIVAWVAKNFQARREPETFI